MKFRTYLLGYFFLMELAAFSQDVFHHVTHQSIYEFLEELASSHLITEFNSAIKPYSRRQIAQWLLQAHNQRHKLNYRQQQELDFYLRDFNKELHTDKRSFRKRLDLFYYSDSLFKVTVNPLLGYQYWTNKNGSFFHRWNGAEFHAVISPRIGVYGLLYDNLEKVQLGKKNYLTQRTGAAYKENPFSEKGEYSEARGGITYSWRWGHFSILKDHFVWGNNYHGANLFSGKSPSFPHLKLQMHPVKWLFFNYVHGFLVSDVVDTTRSYKAGARNRTVFVQKFLAANMLTVEPWRKLQISAGNSIIYSDEFQLAYLIPVYFFKSVDHTITNTGGNFTGQNSQLYFDISSRNIRYLHLYLSVFVDEFSKARFNTDRASNFFSIKAGAALTHPFLFNTTWIVEYTRTNPIVYKHFVNTTTFESNQYNLGHYLRDNAEELYLAVRWRPLSRLHAKASFTAARKGPDYEYLGTGGSGLGLPFIEQTMWKQTMTAIQLRYELFNDISIMAASEWSHARGEEAYLNAYTAPVWRGKTHTFTAALSIGF